MLLPRLLVSVFQKYLVFCKVAAAGGAPVALVAVHMPAALKFDAPSNLPLP